ncbi:hypothetical protein G7009_27060 [Pseudomonas capeferrum]|jgi:hypothetical protein|uniref:hypothetical protein n=1 Tax=Pseudomonas capeferrum TaxID=1495066 RepID=UPI0015E3B1F1|nr:hypothetical protein [Pseudomonas capeferrum]MBA1205370.1 hypothetical protein [Pseudomonas capeferrum]
MYQKGPENQPKWMIASKASDLLASVECDDFAITAGLLSQKSTEMSGLAIRIWNY